MENKLNYGLSLAEKIKEEKAPTMYSHYDHFVDNYGYQYETEELLKVAYDRCWKSQHGILLTEEEFVAEAGKLFDVENVKKAYAKIYNLCKDNILTATDMYCYARRKYCLNNPKAITWYKEDVNTFHVNKCDDEISINEAIILINKHWGFEAGRIEIVDTPYYCATDYQFIRFDVCGMPWLWDDGDLCTVYC